MLEAPVGLKFPFMPSGLLQAMCLVAESAFWKQYVGRSMVGQDMWSHLSGLCVLFST